MSSTSDPCACRTWPELATPPPRCRSVATCGRSHLCVRGPLASGRVLTSHVVGTFKATTIQVHTTHSARARMESFPGRGVTGVCETDESGAYHRLVGFSGCLGTRGTMADSTSPALNRTLDTIGKCTGLTNYREWGETCAKRLVCMRSIC